MNICTEITEPDLVCGWLTFQTKIALLIWCDSVLYRFSIVSSLFQPWPMILLMDKYNRNNFMFCVILSVGVVNCVHLLPETDNRLQNEACCCPTVNQEEHNTQHACIAIVFNHPICLLSKTFCLIHVWTENPFTLLYGWLLYICIWTDYG